MLDKIQILPQYFDLTSKADHEILVAGPFRFYFVLNYIGNFGDIFNSKITGYTLKGMQ